MASRVVAADWTRQVGLTMGASLFRIGVTEISFVWKWMGQDDEFCFHYAVDPHVHDMEQPCEVGSDFYRPDTCPNGETVKRSLLIHKQQKTWWDDPISSTDTRRLHRMMENHPRVNFFASNFLGGL